MTINSAALSFLAGPRQTPGRPGASSGGSKAASPSQQQCDLVPGDELASGPAAAGAQPSDLAPSANTFIRKLFQMVTTENQDIIAFTPDGLSFHVKDPARLEKEVLPKYFRHSRFQSLVRQLNFYDFKKISKERVIWIYRHPLFQARKPHLLDDLKRKPSASLVKQQQSGTGIGGSASKAPGRKGGSGGSASKGSRSSSRPHSPFDPASQSDSGGNTTEADYYTYDDDEEDEEGPYGDEASTDGSEGGRRGSSSSSSPSGGSSKKRRRKSSDGGLGSLSEAAASRKRRAFYYSDEEDEEEEESNWDQEAEGEDEACWVMRQMKQQPSPEPLQPSPPHRAPRLSLECHEEGFQEEQAGPDGPLVAGEGAWASSTSTKRRAEEQASACRAMEMEDEHLQTEQAAATPCAPTGAGALVGEGSHSPARKPMAVALYEPTAAEAKAWARVQALWAAAGEAAQTDLFAQLPSSDHAAFVGFFVTMAPFHSTSELIRACHDLLVACPALANAVQKHRLALDPLSPCRPRHPSDKTFLLGCPSMPHDGPGHNNRALRDVLGFGLNHLVEAAAAIPPHDARPAAVALRDCLAQWRAHTGRLL